MNNIQCKCGTHDIVVSCCECGRNHCEMCSLTECVCFNFTSNEELHNVEGNALNVYFCFECRKKSDTWQVCVDRMQRTIQFYKNINAFEISNRKALDNISFLINQKLNKLNGVEIDERCSDKLRDKLNDGKSNTKRILKKIISSNNVMKTNIPPLG